MQQVRILAPCKINLYLNIHGIDTYQYHTLSTVMQSVSLADELYLVRKKSAQRQVTIESKGIAVPLDSSNLAVAAAHLFLDTIDKQDQIHIALKKQIPTEAGLGGGSADAAAVLVGLNEIYRTRFSKEHLAELSIPLGVDIPQCILGGTALGTHYGEVLTPLPHMPSCFFVIVKPMVGVATLQAYQSFDNSQKIPSPPLVQPLLDALFQQDLIGITKNLYNAFEAVVTTQETILCKEIFARQAAFGTSLSGSGSAVYGVFENQTSALRTAKFFQEQGFFARVARPLHIGASVISW